MRFSCVVQYFHIWYCLSPLLFSSLLLFLPIKCLYQVRPNYLTGGFELEWRKKFIAVTRVYPVMRELAQSITSNRVISWQHSFSFQYISRWSVQFDKQQLRALVLKQLLYIWLVFWLYQRVGRMMSHEDHTWSWHSCAGGEKLLLRDA